MTGHDLGQTTAWMRDGTSLVLDLVDGVTDQAMGEPCALPGWSRAHLVGHLARNAEALGRLAAWARTGVETPMYSSAEQRAVDIESSARQPPEVLRRDVAVTAAALDHALAQLDSSTWTSTVRSALGRELPASGIPWMRVREVWLHAVDLAAGATMADIPLAVVSVLLTDVVTTLSARPECPSARLAPTDSDGLWYLGPDIADEVSVSGTSAALLAWVAGRDDGQALLAADRAGQVVARPDLPRWL